MKSIILQDDIPSNPEKAEYPEPCQNILKDMKLIQRKKERNKVKLFKERLKDRKEKKQVFQRKKKERKKKKL